MFVDELQVLDYTTHFGTIGVYGKIGFGDLLVSVKNTFYDRSISLHAPAKIIFEIDGNFNTFHTSVALNDSSEEDTTATFLVFADDKLVAYAPDIRKSTSPQDIIANISGAKTLTLQTETKNPANCHSVWLDPKLDTELLSEIDDILCNTKAVLPQVPIIADKCIFTMVTPTYVKYAVNMIKSLHRHTPSMLNTKIVVLGYELSRSDIAIFEQLKATVVKCKCDPTLNKITKKIIIYRIATIVKARKYMFIDADCLVCNDITHLFNTIDHLQPECVMGVKFNQTSKIFSLKDAIVTNYKASEIDCSFLKMSELEKNSTTTINSGFFVASDRAMLSVEQTIKSFMPNIKKWEAQYDLCLYREEAVLLLSLARLQSATLIKDIYNLQMHDELNYKNVDIIDGKVEFNKEPVFIAHFVGDSKTSNKYNEIVSLTNKEYIMPNEMLDLLNEVMEDN